MMNKFPEFLLDVKCGWMMRALPMDLHALL